MPNSYSNFRSLMEQDEESKRYFESMPYQVKQAVSVHSQNIDSFESLHNYTEHFLNHDK